MKRIVMIELVVECDYPSERLRELVIEQLENDNGTEYKAFVSDIKETNYHNLPLQVGLAGRK
jgi:hypothetical protein